MNNTKIQNPTLRFKQNDGTDFPDWEERKLGEVCDIFRGGSPRPINNFITNGDGINWLKIGDVPSNGKYVTSTEKKIKSEGQKKSRVVEKGDFILSNSMSFGRPYIMDIQACIHDGWLALTKYNTTFNINYLYYSILSQSIYSQFISMASGSGVKNLNKDSPPRRTKKDC